MSITTPWQYCPIIREVSYLDHSKQVYLQGVTESLTEYPILHDIIDNFYAKTAWCCNWQNEDSEPYNQHICWNETFLVINNP